MLFRRLILCAVVIGLVAGVLLGMGEQFTTAPLIHAAEQYEQPTVEAGGHHREAAAWQPADGLERTVFTVLAAVCEAIGYAALLLVAMSAARLVHGVQFSLLEGLGWGVAAFATVFLIPSFGLSPEVPGTQAAPLAARQFWWLATALLTAIVCWLLAYGPPGLKWLSPLLLFVPFLYGAPAPAGARFAGHSAVDAQALAAIHARFVYATASVNLLLWLLLGLACAWAMRRWLQPMLNTRPHRNASART